MATGTCQLLHPQHDLLELKVLGEHVRSQGARENVVPVHGQGGVGGQCICDSDSRFQGRFDLMSHNELEVYKASSHAVDVAYISLRAIALTQLQSLTTSKAFTKLLRARSLLI